MSSNSDKLHGWAGVAKGKPLVQMDLPLKKWDEDSVEMQVTHCGICGSDNHTLNESWDMKFEYPICVGHEIVGKVTRVGANVKKVKVGDRAGVGAQSSSCHKCKNCLEGNENVCPNAVYTYASQWPCGTWSSGGYADKWRGDYRFVFKIPDNLPSEIAATFFCAGITTYAPLKRFKVGKGSVVGVMGIGGLGHYGIKWAKAMGAKVVGMSHNDKKHDVALELGCDDYINTSNEKDMARYNKTLTHILCTGTSPDFQWAPYFALLLANGHFMNVSAPNWNFPELNPLVLLVNQVSINGSTIGSPTEIEDMLAFAEKHNVRPWIQLYPMKDVNKALDDFRAGKPRFRFVLEN